MAGRRLETHVINQPLLWNASHNRCFLYQSKTQEGWGEKIIPICLTIFVVSAVITPSTKGQAVGLTE